jgi:hypothetical protein
MNGRLISTPSGLLLLLGLGCVFPRSVFPAAGATLRNVADLRIAAGEPRRAAAGGARAMLRYRCPGLLAARSACRLLVDRVCGCGPLCNQPGELEPGAVRRVDVIKSAGTPW